MTVDSLEAALSELRRPFTAQAVNCDGACILWARGGGSGGYGMVWWNGKRWLAHRLSYELHVGPIPAKHDLHHRCGVRRCVNPRHLEPLTRAQHMRIKGHSRTRLSESDVARIKASHEPGKCLAERYGVVETHIAGIRGGSGRSWK